MSNTSKTIIAIIALVIVLMIGYKLRDTQQSFGYASRTWNVLGSLTHASSTACAVAGDPCTVLSRNVALRYLEICNPGVEQNTVYVHLTSTTSTLSTSAGIPIYPATTTNYYQGRSCVEFGPDVLPISAVQAIASASTTILLNYSY